MKIYRILKGPELITAKIRHGCLIQHLCRIKFHSAAVNLTLFSAIWLLSCGEDANPVIRNREIKNASLNSVKFLPKRKYATVQSEVPVLLEGLFKGFTCSTVEHSLQNSTDTLRISVNISLPQQLNTCPLSPAEGIDTVININLNMWDSLPRLIYLQTGKMKTDSIWLTAEPQYFIQGDSALVDTLADSSDILNSLFSDSISLKCGDALSFAFYCVSKNTDSLFYRAAVQENWHSSECDSMGKQPFEPEYWHRLNPDSTSNCQQNLLEDSLRAYRLIQ